MNGENTMLEAEMKILNERLESLNVNLEVFNKNIEALLKQTPAPVAEEAPTEEQAVDEKPAPIKKRATKKKVEEPVEPETTEEPESDVDQAETVSIDDLQRFVLGVVREKRHLRDKIKDLVQEITGAKFMGDVPADKAGELKAAIEKLVGEENE